MANDTLGDNDRALVPTLQVKKGTAAQIDVVFTAPKAWQNKTFNVRVKYFQSGRVAYGLLKKEKGQTTEQIAQMCVFVLCLFVYSFVSSFVCLLFVCLLFWLFVCGLLFIMCNRGMLPISTPIDVWPKILTWEKPKVDVSPIPSPSASASISSLPFGISVRVSWCI